jgi:aldose 1-epimerase
MLGEIDCIDVFGFRLSGGEPSIEMMTFGATLTRVERPDCFGRVADIVIGYDDLTTYETAPGNAAGMPIALRKGVLFWMAGPIN